MPEQKPPPKPQAPVKPGPGSAPQKPPPPDNITVRTGRVGPNYETRALPVTPPPPSEKTG
jgi:hypothetical protein